MISVVFVHGIGVRQPAYDELFNKVSGELRATWYGTNTIKCYWGEKFGARLCAEGKSIPTYDTARAVGDEDTDETLRNRLRADPLYELRLLGTVSRGSLGDDAGGDIAAM